MTIHDFIDKYLKGKFTKAAIAVALVWFVGSALYPRHNTGEYQFCNSVPIVRAFTGGFATVYLIGSVNRLPMVEFGGEPPTPDPVVVQQRQERGEAEADTTNYRLCKKPARITLAKAAIVSIGLVVATASVEHFLGQKEEETQ